MSDVFESGLLKQRAVYWAPLGEGPDGNMRYDEPIEIACRWTDMNRLFIKQNGETSTSRAYAMVDRDLELGGMLMLSKLEDVEDPDEPGKNRKAQIIAGWNKVPDENAVKFVRTAICQ